MAMVAEINAVHSWICDPRPDDRFGYFGWPTVARLADNTLVAASSGFRDTHLCPFGKSVLFRSADAGGHWSTGEIINDSPVDDRDTGLVSLPDGSFLLSWFGSDTRHYWKLLPERFQALLQNWDDETVLRNIGSFVRHCAANGRWGVRKRVPVTAPHGPILLKTGELLFIGTLFDREDGIPDMSMLDKGITAVCASSDMGETWQRRGTIATPADHGYFGEPHAIELADGRILAMIRNDAPDRHFSIWQSISSDGGGSWSAPVMISHGAPPHLMRHSSGILICSVSWREKPYGQRVVFSTDEGASWSGDWILRDDGPTADLGYPSTVELADGALLTVYYQQRLHSNNCGIAVSRWRLPDEIAPKK